MKRPAGTINGAYLGDTLENFSEQQLTLIGSVAMVYNVVEEYLHEITGHCFRYPAGRAEITTRINGTEGLAAIAENAIKRFPSLEKADKIDLCETLSYFKTMKTYRDAVVHAQPFSPGLGIGRQRGRQVTSNDVLLTEDAVRWLRDQLCALQKEMREMGHVVGGAEFAMQDRFSSDEHRERVLKGIQDSLSQYRHYRTLRQDGHKPPPPS